MYNSYAKPMISYGILAYGSAKKTKLSSIFCLQKRILKTIFFKKRGDHVCNLFKRYNVLSVFDLNFDALVKEILDQITKVSPLIFFDVDSNRPNTRASIKSLIPLPKVKTQTQKKSLRFSIIKMFNYLAKESLLPKQVSKEQIFSIRNKLRAHYLDNKDVFDLFFFSYCTFFLWAPLVESFDSYGVQGGKLIKLNILYKMLCIIYHLNLNQSINQSKTQQLDKDHWWLKQTEQN